jgi:hypothetical protein
MCLLSETACQTLSEEKVTRDPKLKLHKYCLTKKPVLLHGADSIHMEEEVSTALHPAAPLDCGVLLEEQSVS